MSTKRHPQEARIEKILAEEGLTIEQAAKLPDDTLLRVPWIGRKQMRSIREIADARRQVEPDTSQTGMTPEQIKKARQVLGLSQRQLGEALGWSGAKQVSNIETGARPITVQTALAVECLLRRAGKRSELIGDLRRS